MRRFFIAVLVLVVTLGLVATAVAAPNGNSGGNFKAHLTGDQEIPPNDSQAQGQAHFKVSKDESSIDFKLNVANIENVVAAHIHRAPVGANGPVVVSLYGSAAPGGGRTDGVLAQGTITAADLVGPLAGHPLSDLIAEIKAGNAYVNVHTNDGVAPTNTGPGDLASGEIRGQIR